MIGHGDVFKEEGFPIGEHPIKEDSLESYPTEVCPTRHRLDRKCSTDTTTCDIEHRFPGKLCECTWYPCFLAHPLERQGEVGGNSFTKFLQQGIYSYKQWLRSFHATSPLAQAQGTASRHHQPRTAVRRGPVDTGAPAATAAPLVDGLENLLMHLLLLLLVVVEIVLFVAADLVVVIVVGRDAKGRP